MGAGILAALVEADTADGAGHRGLELHAELDRAGIGGVHDRRGRRGRKQRHIGRPGDGDCAPGRWRFQIDAVVDGAGENGIGAGNLRRPGVCPALVAGRRVPAGTVVGRDLDAGDHAADVRGRAGNRDDTTRRQWCPRALMTEVGLVWSVEAVAGVSPDCSVPGWMPMSASKLTIACCTRGSVGVAWRS